MPPTWTLDDPRPRLDLLHDRERAWAIGIAYPSAPPDWPLSNANWLPVDAALSMPTTRPELSSSRAARVAGLDVGIRLDQARELLRVPSRRVTRRDGLVEAGDVTGGRRQAAGAAGVAERRHGIADLDGSGVAGVDRLEAGRAGGLDQGHVVGHRVTDHLRAVAAVGAGHDDADRGGARDDVVVGQDLAGRCQHHPGAGALAALVGEVALDDDDAAPEAPRGALRRGADAPGGECGCADQRAEDGGDSSGAAFHTCIATAASLRAR